MLLLLYVRNATTEQLTKLRFLSIGGLCISNEYLHCSNVRRVYLPPMGGRDWNTDRIVDFGTDADFLRCKTMANQGETALTWRANAFRQSTNDENCGL